MMNATPYLLIRLLLAASFFGHGIVRIPKINTFSEGIIKEFGGSMIPQSLVLPMSYVIPVAEFVFGLLLLVGLFTRFATVGAAILLLLLILGSCLIESFGSLPSQFIHMGCCVIILQFIESNKYSIDHWVFKK